jgi:hypothetical protein
MPRPGKNGESRADPNLAALLTWFVPGAGHLYMGRGLFALIAFALVEGLYWLGVQLSDGMTFEFLQEELRTRMAPALTPEVGNVGALVWQMKTYGFGPEPYYPTPFPATIKLGATLSALSGVLNAVLMVRAYADAKFTPDQRKRGPCPSIAVLAGFLVPGLGHWLQGRRARGITTFALLVGLFALATVLAEGSNLDRERHFYYWAGQFMLGLPAMLAELVHDRRDPVRGCGRRDRVPRRTAQRARAARRVRLRRGTARRAGEARAAGIGGGGLGGVKDLGVHVVLFLIVSFAIAVLGSMFAESRDAPALRGLPRRFLMFVAGCAILTALMLLCEHTFAS